MNNSKEEEEDNNRNNEEKEKRLFFIAFTLGKYVDYYSQEYGDGLIDEDVIDSSIESTDGELKHWYKEPVLSDHEMDLLWDCIKRTDERVTELDDKEREKLK